MKKLIIHIGFPKTATTSLQHNLFLELSKKGHLGYFGRADEDLEFKDSYMNIASKIRALLYEMKCLELPREIGNSNLAVLSDEGLTIPAFYNNYSFGHKYSIFEFPRLLQETFRTAYNDIQILISLRRQADLLEALYIQRYDRFFNDELQNTTERHFFEETEFKHELFAELNFPAVIESYRSEFGAANVRVQLYEDLQHSEECYFSELAQLIRIEGSVVIDLLKKEKRNVKTKKGNKVYRTYRRRAPSYVFIANQIKKMGGGFMAALLPEWIKQASFCETKILAPGLTACQKERIMNHYRPLNGSLKLLGLDSDKLRAYGYI